MKLKDAAIQKIANFVVGDSNKWPVRNSTKLVDFFNALGFKEENRTLENKVRFAKEKLTELNNKPKLKEAIESMLDPRCCPEVISDKFEACVDEVNELLTYDNYKVVPHGKCYKVRELSGGIIEMERDLFKDKELSESTIEEHIQKCREKVESGDYSGAITNARSLVESVCTKIAEDLDPNNAIISKDELDQRQFKNVFKLLNLDPSRQDISNSLRQVLSGLSSIINGLSSIRNKMSDAHGVAYKPSRHHAKLAVNSAKTLADFLFDTMSYQTEKGSLNKKYDR